MRLADLMFWAYSRSTSRFMTKGLNSSRAICLGRPHWCRRSCGPTTMTERPDSRTRLPSRFWRNRPCLPFSMSDSDFSGRLPGPVTGRPRRPLSNSSVDGLLQHALLVVDDDLGRAEVEEALQPVVAVDHPAVEVVEVGRGEPATVELHHRAQVGRDHRAPSRAPCAAGS